jgi:lysosomal acid lipase/cholesteryl ester hydrolase
MHGIFGSSSDWIINEQDKAPAFKLARAGYDVWMGNNRGGYYAQWHINKTITDTAYWHFNNDDLALKDLKTIIDKVLTTNGASKLAAYIGHSTGSTEFFMGAALDPSYFGSKVQLNIALAPITRLDFTDSPYGSVAAWSTFTWFI